MAADRPWKRPGALRYALTRLRGFWRSPVEVYAPQPDTVVVRGDVAVTTRDGTVLRANVYLPIGEGPFPVLVCAHPYGKDNLPRKRRRGYSVPIQYRVLRQPSPVRFSTLTSWEAPDPAWWTAQGFAVLNCDLRGAGRSDGVGALLSDQEGEDVYDLIEWAATQSWSDGAVGMIGVSYLAISQWKADNLHSRGSVRGFEQISSPDRHLHTHRGGKWATFYSAAALQAQLAFFDRHLRGATEAPMPRVRLEVREDRDRVVEVRAENSWPLESTQWTALHLGSAGLGSTPAEQHGSTTFHTRWNGTSFGWTLPEDTEITGPMALRLFVEVHHGDDVNLFVGVEKWRGGEFVPFEGSYGFGRDRVTCGWLKASMRALDQKLSRPFEPVPRLDARNPLRPGQVVGVDIALGPSSTLFRAGEQLRLVVAGRWLWPRNPLTGQFPAAYERGPRDNCTLHWGPDRDARLLIPVIR